MSEIYRTQGVIANIVSKKAFGFISEAISRTEYFFHKDDYLGDWNELVKTFEEITNKQLRSKIVVTFEPKTTSKGPRAANVRWGHE